MKNILLLCLLGSIVLSAIKCDNIVEASTLSEENSTNLPIPSNPSVNEESTQDENTHIDLPEQSLEEQNTSEEKTGTAPAEQSLDDLFNQYIALKQKCERLERDTSNLFNRYQYGSLPNEERQKIKKELDERYSLLNEYHQTLDYLEDLLGYY